MFINFKALILTKIFMVKSLRQMLDAKKNLKCTSAYTHVTDLAYQN